MFDRFGICGRLQAFTVPPSDRPYDDLELRALTVRGNATCVLDDHNLVVDQGLSAVAKFLGGNKNSPLVGGLGLASIEDIVITTMQLGNAVAPPAPVNAATTGLLALIFSPVLVVSYPDAYSVKFSGLVPPLEHQGVTFTEECLRMANGLVFAKTVFSVVKPSATNVGLQFNHTFSFARA